MTWDNRLFNRSLATRRFGRELVCLSEVDSTNRWMLEHAHEFPMTGSTVVTDHQTAGRGRFDRSWVDSKGKSLLCSILVRVGVGVESRTLVNLLPAMALARKLSPRLEKNHKLMLKWPNDVLLNGKKIAGVLGQTTATGGRIEVVLGIGVNVAQSQSDFPEELRDRATSWLVETGDKLQREILLAELLQDIEILFDSYLDREVDFLRKEWEKFGPKRGQVLRRSEGGSVVQGSYCGLGESGELILEQEGGKQRVLFSGEIET